MSEIIFEIDDEVHEVALLTSWQSVPLPIIAIIWTNNEFRREFLEDPSPILRGLVAECPHNLSFCVLENTDQVRHLILPFRNESTFGWDKEKVREQLVGEMGYDLKNLDYGLPNDLIVESMFDMEFKRQLLVSPAETLKERGYQIDENIQYFVHENTELTSHVLLPYNKWSGMGLSLEQLQYRVVEELKTPQLH